MSEGLCYVLKVEVQNGNIKCLKIFNLDSPITHQQFVNDTLLSKFPLCREDKTFKHIIEDFQATLGMEFNLNESQVSLFNPSQVAQAHIYGFQEIQQNSLPSKYFGPPLLENSLRYSSWEEILSKFDKRLSSWTFIYLNIHGRLIILQLMLQSLPIYLS